MYAYMHTHVLFEIFQDFRQNVPSNYLVSNFCFLFCAFCISRCSLVNTFIFINKLNKTKHISYLFLPQLQQVREVELDSESTPVPTKSTAQ